MQLRVKPLEFKHLATIQSLCQELGYQTTLPDLESRWNKLQTLSNHALLVLEDESVIGMIHLELVEHFIKEAQVEIKALIVRENQQNKGYGKALLEAATEWARSLQVRKIYLSCNINRDKAHAFYLNNGFKKIKTSDFYEMTV